LLFEQLQAGQNMPGRINNALLHLCINYDHSS
jgi:hypothetical protein